MNHYQRLGVAKNADLATIKQAYRQKIAHQHPDRQGDDDGAVLLNIAYETLKDADKRAKYDQSLSAFTTPFWSPNLQKTVYQAGKTLGKWWQKAQTAWQKSQAVPCVIDLQMAYCGGERWLDELGINAIIPMGVIDGDVLPVQTQQGLAWIKITLADPHSTTQASDVYHRVSIGSDVAKTGGEIILPEPFSLRLRLPPTLTYPNTITLSGRGVPAFLGRQAGDLYLTFVVESLGD